LKGWRVRRLAISILAAAALVGCADSSVREQAKVHQDLDAAITDYESASRGYSRTNSNTPANITEARASMLSQASAKLEPIVNSRGSKVPQLAARQLQADAAAYTAYDAKHSAAVQAARLESSSLNLIRKVQIIAEIEGRIARLSVDEDSLVEQLKKGREGVNAGGLEGARAAIVELQEQRSSIQSDLDKLQSTLDSMRKNIDALRAKAQNLRAGAFVADPDKKSELEYEASAIDRQIEAAETRLNKVAAEHAAMVAEVDLYDRRISSQQEIASNLEAAIDVVNKRTSEREAARGEQLALRDQAMADLIAAVRDHSAAFEERVSKPYASAAAKLTEAITQLASASSAAKMISDTSVRMDVLSKRVILADIQSQHAVALAGMIQTFEVLYANTVQLGEDATALKEILEPLRSELDRVVGDAREVVDEGTKLANELDAQISEGDPAKDVLIRNAGALDAAAARAGAAAEFTQSK